MALRVGDSLSSSRTGLASAVEPLTNGDASQSRRTQGVMNAQEAGQPIHLLLKEQSLLGSFSFSFLQVAHMLLLHCQFLGFTIMC